MGNGRINFIARVAHERATCCVFSCFAQNVDTAGRVTKKELPFFAFLQGKRREGKEKIAGEEEEGKKRR